MSSPLTGDDLLPAHDRASEANAPSEVNFADGRYTVVARRYRPQTFQELVGQGSVAQGLANAIQTQRVGHAYLFTGARGVGKTSTARIFAKSLNCFSGPTLAPCGKCDVCRGIASGGDVDVLEIDGASNRGIDEIRSLRANVNVRPSRARYKIYIIDEVHMLTTQAFNALLKTLEEPPEHVKFIFCTTEADKIPITVLSRCQRFDFAPMELAAIIGQLEHITATEGITAEPEALQIIARRAAGSMRDSQSLLEQLLSFGGSNLTAADVNAMLGTADGGRLIALVQTLIARDLAGSLKQLDAALSAGIDVGQLAEQLLGYLRDTAAAFVGCGPDSLLHASAADHALLAELGANWGLETLLAAVQILDHTLVRMRQSTHSRTLLEMALIRIGKLEDLDQLGTLVAQLKALPAGGPVAPSGRVSAAPLVSTARAPASAPAPSAPPPRAVSSENTEQKKTFEREPAPVNEPEIAESGPALTQEQGWELWKQTVFMLTDSGDVTSTLVQKASDVAISGPNRLAVIFPGQYSYQKEACERPDRRTRLESAVSAAAGRKILLEFRLGEKTAKPATEAPIVPQAATLAQKAQLRREKERHPFVMKAAEMFEAEVEQAFQGSRPKKADDAGAEAEPAS